MDFRRFLRYFLVWMISITLISCGGTEQNLTQRQDQKKPALADERSAGTKAESEPETKMMEELCVVDGAAANRPTVRRKALKRDGAVAEKGKARAMYYLGGPAAPAMGADNERFSSHNTESYDLINENNFLAVADNPLSTFSIDVDTASYANLRRFLNNGTLPPKDAVRIEEMINYFTYSYPQPEDSRPFSVVTEISDCPWNDAHRLIHIGLQGRKMNTENTPPSNLVFLIDISGSMRSPNKLGLLKQAFKLLVNQLRDEDRVAIAVYAGSQGLALPSTPGSNKQKILDVLDNLRAGGSTAGAAGIRLAYQVAVDNLIKDGNNRVILATDGDFNVGVSSDAELVRLIEEKRKQGVFLTCLGFGMGNYKDSKMEKLADKGNGNYAYIDSILEAKKVLVSEMTSTLFTIAKDVKLQIEFNPAKVKGYRLIGYENRLLNKEDFNDDKKDAGELGAGHTVTALYELIPAGSDEKISNVDKLKYQSVKTEKSSEFKDEVLTVKLRYKEPDAEKSTLMVHPVRDLDVGLGSSTENFRFSAAVAGFGMLLRDSKYKGDLTYDSVLTMAKGAQGEDRFGYRAELISLINKAQVLSGIAEK